MIVEVDGVRGAASPVRLSGTPATYRRRPPAFAEHIDAILGEIGIAGEEFEGAVARQIRNP
ncbi:hypothetical protein [Mesorhizobium sp. L-8-3]|uniref:hypothetical protein n=1 Tax=Mesorhizobium sp. L-8-3 TaxID=2744522 RepID=UPI0019363075|nr:hypothetical protein [Mesorhizobium sp. L-8-3]BCH21099.1 hypothetical protein MesoLjLb_08840 [Mesorhizobium sp. L-8-3]